MEIVHPEFVPDPGTDRDEMESQQRAIASRAVFEDALECDPTGIAVPEPISDRTAGEPSGSGPIVVGIDQAFFDDMAVSAAVAIQDGHVVETNCGRTPVEIPYIPGLLSFREGGPIIDALQDLTVDPDILLLDGSGRIHFRQAGIATHMGVLFETPAIGVAKNLLCGRLSRPIEDPLEVGTRIPIEADDAVDAAEGTIIGYAFQSRQFENTDRRHVNPLYVSPGHRVSAETAVSIVESTCAGYKLPEPIRLADRAADDCKD